MRAAIIVADFNKEITQDMETAAINQLKKNKITNISIIHVPGSFEVPFAAKQIIKKVDIIVALGAVIQGDTHHDIILVDTIAPALMELSLKHNKPIGFGIIGPRVTEKQAKDRATDYAARAVKAALALQRIKNND